MPCHHDLDPAAHARLLHPAGRRGHVALARQDGQWHEAAVPIPLLEERAGTMLGQVDAFVSQHAFRGWRRIAHLAQLGACYVDLDYYRTERWAGARPEHVTDAVLLALEDADLPAPSYVMASGRGLLVTWLLHPVPRAALPRWSAVQRHLADALASFGSDRGALDAARVFRLAGTQNSRTGALVRPTYLPAAPAAIPRWGFDDLCHEVLPLTRDELEARRRSKRYATSPPGERAMPARRLTVASYWDTVLTDLQRLRRLRHGGVLPPGQRDTWLFLACVALSWLVPPGLLRREFQGLAQDVGGWTEGDARSRMATVFRRAEAAAAGQRVEWNGRMLDPRYRVRAATMAAWLQVTPAEMHAANLRVLRDGAVARERERDRWHARRAAAGGQDRKAYTAPARERRSRVGALRQAGLSWRAVGMALGISEGEARRLARAAA